MVGGVVWKFGGFGLGMDSEGGKAGKQQVGEGEGAFINTGC